MNMLLGVVIHACDKFKLPYCWCAVGGVKAAATIQPAIWFATLKEGSEYVYKYPFCY